MLFAAEAISKRFSGTQALFDVSMQIDLQERVGLIGPNGAGKSTFFNCLLGTMRPDGGSVVLAGEDVTGLSSYRLARRGLGRTFQRIEVFAGLTVEQHFIVADRARTRCGRLWRDLLGRGAPTDEERSRAAEMLAELGLDRLAERPVETLSLGQNRLVEVGRALMSGPRLLLLDEPSSGLDRTETRALASTLRTVQERKGFAILLVEHDVELIREFVSRLYVLDTGRLLAHGPTEAVLADDAVRQAYLGSAG
jgi:branched-chain amino acid transport system ATP-binding protein